MAVIYMWVFYYGLIVGSLYAIEYIYYKYIH